MGGAVVAAEATAVHEHAHRQFLDGHVMNDHVIGALHEGGVDRQEGLESLRGETTGKERRMFLRNADVKIALRDFLFEDAQTGAARHGRRDGHDLLVSLREIRHAARKDGGVGGRAGGRLASLDVVFAETMEFARISQRGFVAAALLRDDVQNDRLGLRLEKLKGLDEQAHVMTIDWPIISEAEFLEDHRGRGRRLLGSSQHEALGALLHLAGETTHSLAGDLFKNLRRLLMQRSISRMRGDMIEVFRDGADVAVNAPLVVVEHHDKPPRLGGDIVERFKHRAAGEGGVA